MEFNPAFSQQQTSGGSSVLPFGKYEPLPGITSPRPEKAAQSFEMYPQISMFPKMPLDLQRVQALELRVASLEQSNRVLLDELVSTKNESKGAIRRVESTVSEEMSNQRNMVQTFKANADFISQLAQRVKRNEEQIQGGQLAVNGLMEQVRRVNQLVSNGQNSSSGRNDVLDSRLLELHSSVEESRSERQQMLGVASSLHDKFKSLEQRVDTKIQDLSSVSIEVRKKSLAVEDQTRNLLEQFKRSQDYQGDLDYSNQQLKTQIDMRIAEFQGVLNDLRNKTMKDETERRNGDQLINRKLADLQYAVSDLQRSFSDVQHESSKVRQDMTTLFETESGKLNDQISRFLDDFRRKLHDSEMKVKEETSSKHSQLEKALNEERDNRLAAEKSIREEVRDSLAEIKEKSKEDLQQYKKSKKSEKQKITDSLNVVNEGLNAVERHQDEWFDKLTKSLRAEIKTRESSTEAVYKKISELDVKFAEALGLVEQNVKMKNPERAVPYVETPPPLGVRRETIGELERNVKLLTDRISNLQSSIDEKSKETLMLRNSMSLSNASGIEKINETLNQVIEWYGKSTKQVDDVNNLFLEKVAPRIDEIERELENMKKVTMIKISEERSLRSKDVNEVRLELKTRKKEAEIRQEETLESVKKLKDETEQLAAAILHVRQSMRQSLDEQVFRLDSHIADESKKKTDQIVQIRQDVNHLSSIVEANLVPVNEYSMTSNYRFQNPQIYQQLGHPESLMSTYNTPVIQQPLVLPSQKATTETQTSSHQETQTLQEVPADARKPKSPGTAMQTIESYLADIRLVNGHPTRGIQTGKSVLDVPPSPGVKLQTSFLDSSKQSSGIYVQTSPTFQQVKTESEKSFVEPEAKPEVVANAPPAEELEDDEENVIGPMAGLNIHAPEGEHSKRVEEMEQTLRQDSVYQKYLQHQLGKDDSGEQKDSVSGDQKDEPTDPKDRRKNEHLNQEVQAGDSYVGEIASRQGHREKSKSASSVGNKSQKSLGSNRKSSRKASKDKKEEPNLDDLEYKSQSSKKRSLPIDDD